MFWNKEKDPRIEDLEKEVSSQKDRIVRLEGMYVDTFKKLNDTFEIAMQSLIKESASLNKFIVEVADKKVDEMRESINNALEALSNISICPNQEVFEDNSYSEQEENDPNDHKRN